MNSQDISSVYDVVVRFVRIRWHSIVSNGKEDIGVAVRMYALNNTY